MSIMGRMMRPFRESNSFRCVLFHNRTLFGWGQVCIDAWYPRYKDSFLSIFGTGDWLYICCSQRSPATPPLMGGVSATLAPCLSRHGQLVKKVNSRKES